MDGYGFFGNYYSKLIANCDTLDLIVIEPDFLDQTFVASEYLCIVFVTQFAADYKS